MGVTAVCALLAACGDDAPSTPIDSGTADVGLDEAVADAPLSDAPVPMDTNPPSDVPVTPPDAVAGDAQDGSAPPDGGSPDGGSPDGGAPDGGDGGAGGDASVRAHRGTALVNAGGVMNSTRFRMLSTLGQSSVHQGAMRSTTFRLQGGLIGATGGTSR